LLHQYTAGAFFIGLPYPNEQVIDKVIDFNQAPINLFILKDIFLNFFPATITTAGLVFENLASIASRFDVHITLFPLLVNIPT
jgi:hypothetical protein|tara:strand:- start:63462 stop:63710 length:249 start_codon:yes stop_codon:yes gene_type:complete